MQVKPSRILLYFIFLPLFLISLYFWFKYLPTSSSYDNEYENSFFYTSTSTIPLDYNNNDYNNDYNNNYNDQNDDQNSQFNDNFYNKEFNNEKNLYNEKNLNNQLNNNLNKNLFENKISYQVHSWNDLRQWIQGYQKGVRFFKIDLFYHFNFKCKFTKDLYSSLFFNILNNFNDKLNNKLNNQLNNKNEKFNKNEKLKRIYLEIKDKIFNLLENEIVNHKHCLILSHDPPLYHINYFNFIDVLFTILEIRSLFDNTQNIDNTLQQDKIVIALCFKYKKPIFNKENTQIIGIQKNPCLPNIDYEWINLVNFLYKLFTIIEKDLNLEFILDESGTPGGIDFLERKCLLHLWKDWPYTFISSRDPKEILFLPNLENLKSENVDNTLQNGLQQGLQNSLQNSLQKVDNFDVTTLQRFKYLNQPIFTQKIANYLKIDPLKFLKEVISIKYGKFNEMENDKLLWEPSDQYDIWKVLNLLKRNIFKNGKLRFSINIDPINLEIFISKFTKKGRNEPLKGTNGLQFPKLVKMDGKILLFVEKENSFGISNLENLNFKFFEKTEKEIVKVFVKNNFLYIFYKNGKIDIFDKFLKIFEKKNLNFELTSVSNLFEENLILIFTKKFELFLVDINHLKILQKFTNLNFYKEILDDTIQHLEIVVSPMSQKLSQKLSQHLDDNIPDDNTLQKTLQNMDIFLFFSTLQNKKIYGTLLNIEIDNKITENNPIHLLGMGNHISTSIFRNFILIFWDEGYCDNNEINNLQNFPFICSIKRKSCKNVLNYNVMTLVTLKKLFKSQKLSIDDKSQVASQVSQKLSIMTSMEYFFTQKNPLIAPSPYLFHTCQQNIFYGSYDRGKFNFILPFKFKNGNLHILEIHEGVCHKKNNIPLDNDPVTVDKKTSQNIPLDNSCDNEENDDDEMECNACAKALPYNGLILDELIFTTSNLLE